MNSLTSRAIVKRFLSLPSSTLISKQLLIAIDAALVVDPLVESCFRLPQSEGSILASLEVGAIIEGKRFEGNLVFLRARGPASLLGRYRRFREKA